MRSTIRLFRSYDPFLVHNRYANLVHIRIKRRVLSSSSSSSSNTDFTTTTTSSSIVRDDRTTETSSKLILPSVIGLQEWRAMVELERTERQQRDMNEIVQPIVQELYRPDLHLPSAPITWEQYEPNTPLTDAIIALIGVSGRPISTADYMNMALTHPQYGYYINATTTKHRIVQRSSASTSTSSNDNPTNNDTTTMDDFDIDEWDVEDKVTQTTNQTIQSIDNSTNTTDTIIGADFVTAPEISHVFGECIGVWFVTQWEQYMQQMQNNNNNNNNNNNATTTSTTNASWQWLEFGPGKGTLMVDLLRFTIQLSSIVQTRQGSNNISTNYHNIDDDTKKSSLLHYFGDGCQYIHFIERSPIFQQQQRESLINAFLNDTAIQFDFLEPKQQMHNNNNSNNNTLNTPTATEGTISMPSPSSSIDVNNNATKRTIKVRWHDTFEDFLQYSDTTKELQQQQIPTFIVGQEFLDALPVYSFEKTKDGYWRERLVDVAVRDDLYDDDNTITTETNSTKTAIDKQTTSRDGSELVKQNKTRLRIVLAPEVTPPLKTLLNTNDEGYLNNDTDLAPIGSVAEVCPEAILLVQDVAKYIQRIPGSAALFIDYGSNNGSSDTLRGYSQHEQVPFISLPGQVDITADVDFAALKHAINYQPNMNDTNNIDSNQANHSIVRAFGPTTQGEFLMAMGIQERIINLMERDDVTEEQAENLYRALIRLASPEEMGERYKVLAITPTTRASTTIATNSIVRVGATTSSNNDSHDSVSSSEVLYNAPPGF